MHVDDEPIEHAAVDGDGIVTGAGAMVEVVVDAGAVKMMPGHMGPAGCA